MTVFRYHEFLLEIVTYVLPFYSQEAILLVTHCSLHTDSKAREAMPVYPAKGTGPGS